MRTLLQLVIALILVCLARDSLAQDQTAITWQLDYSAAVAAAQESHRFLLIQFHEDVESERDKELASQVVEACTQASRIDRFTIVRLAVSTKCKSDETITSLLSHAAFQEMHGRPGLVIIDLRDPTANTFHHVVSVYPLKSGEPISPDGLTVLLDLPPGTLGQRTMILAVRTHAESPASTEGEFHAVLAEESTAHASHQASLQLQGHHQWETRFHRINARLTDGLLAQEVCAESWPGQELLEGARECVHSWRQSSGHWDAVKRRHPVFGYDIRRGANGVWYATGIFAHRL